MDNLPMDGLLAPSLACMCLAVASSWPVSKTSFFNHSVNSRYELYLSPMGRVAQLFASEPIVPSGRMEAPPVHKSEVSLAADNSGVHIVAGFTDPRGFSLNPISTDGLMVSDDGGATFLDQGSLSVPDGEALFGHPQVRYMGGSDFIYTSLMLRKLADGNTLQTLCLYRSNDYGHSWDGPYDITPATLAAGQSGEIADAEYVDVDPETDRVMVTWTSVADPANTENPTKICASYSDDVLKAKIPSWSSLAILNPASRTSDSGAVPRFGRGGLCYATWSETLPHTNLINIALAVSTDKGATWTRPRTLRSSFFLGMDQVQGSDTSNSYPSLAIDRSGGLHEGSIYVVYTDDSTKDGGDVVFQRSIDGGATFSSPIPLSSRPGHDGPQWFPYITVDNISGKICVSYLDQSQANGGDLTNAMSLSSESGGDSWTAPAALGDRPFHASQGSTPSEPNLGEYSEILALGGQACGLVPTRPEDPELDLDSERNRSALLDFAFHRSNEGSVPLSLQRLDAKPVSGRQSIEPGDTVELFPTLFAYTTNLHMSPLVISHVHGHLSTDTPGVTITSGRAAFGDVSAGATVTPSHPFAIEIASDFNVKTPVELVLDLETAEGVASIPIKLQIGELSAQKVLRLDFLTANESGTPNGWEDFARSGAAPSKWQVVKRGATSYLFHNAASSQANALGKVVDEAIVSPEITIPAGQSSRIDFDLSYNTPADPLQAGKAYGGCALRIIDESNANCAYLADSIADSFERSADGKTYMGYPRRLPEYWDYTFMQNTGVWGGASNGIEHVTIRVPSVAGKKIRLEWDYSEMAAMDAKLDPKSTVAPGVSIANLQISSETRKAFLRSETRAKSTTFSLNQGTSIRSSLEKLVRTASGSCSASTFAPDKDPAHGKLYLHDDGLFMYQPNTGFNGEDHFSYRFTDSTGATSVAFVYLLVNPILQNVSCSSAIKSGTMSVVKVYLSGIAPPDGLNLNLVSGNPSLVSVPSSVRVAGTSRTASFPVHCALSAESELVSIHIRLNGIDKVAEFELLAQSFPAASDHVFTAYEGERFEAKRGCLFGGALFKGTSEPRSQKVAQPAHGLLDVNSDGSFEYSPAPGFFGEDTFKYRIVQGEKQSEIASVKIEVLPTIHELAAAKENVLSGSNALLTIFMAGTTPVSGQSVSLRSSNDGLVAVPEWVQVPASTSRYTIQLPTRKVETPTAVTLVASVHGTSRSTTIILAPHRNVVAQGGLFQVNENDSLIQSEPGLIRGAADPNPKSQDSASEPFRAMKVDDPRHGSVTIHANGSFQYVPNVDFIGVDTFTFKVMHGESESDPQTVQLWIDPVLGDFFLDQTSVNGGEEVNAAIGLSGRVKTGAMRVNIDCSQPALVDTPAAVVIESGEEVAKFKIRTHEVATPTTVYVKVKVNGNEKSLMLVLKPSITAP